MEFFIVFGAIFNFCDPRVEQVYGVRVMPVYLAFVIAAAVYVALYAFKAAGLYEMAKKRGMNKFVWCAFVPFASTWLMGKLAGPVRIGRTKFEYFGLLTMISEILLCVSYALQYFPVAYAYVNHLYTITTSVENGMVSYGLEFSSSFASFVKVMNVAYILAYIFMFVNMLLSVFLYMGFFRAYAPQSYIWLTILCVFLPVAGILAFAFRNRKYVDYEKFMQARMEQIRRMQQQGQYPNSPYGNPYGGNPYGGNPNGGNPYGTNPYGPQGGPANQPDDPFGEFSSNAGRSSAGQSSPQDDPFGDLGGGSDDNKRSSDDGKDS